MLQQAARILLALSTALPASVLAVQYAIAQVYHCTVQYSAVLNRVLLSAGFSAGFGVWRRGVESVEGRKRSKNTASAGADLGGLLSRAIHRPDYWPASEIRRGERSGMTGAACVLSQGQEDMPDHSQNPPSRQGRLATAHACLGQSDYCSEVKS